VREPLGYAGDGYAGVANAVANPVPLGVPVSVAFGIAHAVAEPVTDSASFTDCAAHHSGSAASTAVEFGAWQ
jgi:hypothetical protein